jgi:hypothetical protein
MVEPWMVEVNSAGVGRVADALALRIDGQILCTRCGGALDSRFHTWKCPRCRSGGNALIYAALALGAGQADAPSSISWSAVRNALAARGLCHPAA